MTHIMYNKYQLNIRMKPLAHEFAAIAYRSILRN